MSHSYQAPPTLKLTLFTREAYNTAFEGAVQLCRLVATDGLRLPLKRPNLVFKGPPCQSPSPISTSHNSERYRLILQPIQQAFKSLWFSCTPISYHPEVTESGRESIEIQHPFFVSSCVKRELSFILTRQQAKPQAGLGLCRCNQQLWFGALHPTGHRAKANTIIFKV